MRPFVLIFLVALFAWNWSEITWILNSQYLSDFLFNLLLNEEGVMAESFEGADFPYLHKEDTLLIPKIQVQAPIIFRVGNKLADIAEALKKGVVYYPQSVLPGEKGKVIILGHSAPSGWPKINYYHVFNELNELKEGDEIFIYFQNREYRYRVIQKFFVKPGAKLDSFLTNSEKYVLILLSCWPPGQREQRIVIEAQQIF